MYVRSTFIGMTTTLLLSVGLIGCSSIDDAAPAPPDDDTRSITWQPCDQHPNLDCGILQVPRDYSKPEGATLSIVLNRHAADGDASRGSILFNPGGPGGSGVDVILQLLEEDTIPRIILDEYDLVGFDPRGVGRSTPVDCSEFGLDELPDYPASIPELQILVDNSTRIATACHEKYGDYLQQLGSYNVTRDMEEIRKALNEPKLNFIGYSYGTRLAALYLQQYPDTSGAIVLDGSVSPTPSILAVDDGPLKQLQANLEAMFTLCDTTAADCDPQSAIFQLQARINQLLVDGPDEEFELVGEIVYEAALDPEFGEFALRPLLSYLENFDTQALLDFATFIDQLNESDASQTDDTLFAEDNDTALRAVICADDPIRPTVSSLTNLLALFNASSDMFAEAYIPLSASCVGWPEAIEPLTDITTSRAPASIVIGGPTDAQTPLVWSEQMAESIDGVFIRSEHAGHTVVFQDYSACVDDIVVKFIREGQLPESQTCVAD